MKVVTVLGSPNKRGNTATVLGWLEDELTRMGHEVEAFALGDYVVRACTACLACHRGEPVLPSCSQDDDANLILGAMQQAEAFVLASPIFAFGVTAQLKALLDRSCSMVHWRDGHSRQLLGGRRSLLLATGEDGLERNLDLLVPPYELLMEYHGCDNAGHLLVPYCTSPDKLGPEVEARARGFASTLLPVALRR